MSKAADAIIGEELADLQNVKRDSFGVMTQPTYEDACEAMGNGTVNVESGMNDPAYDPPVSQAQNAAMHAAAAGHSTLGIPRSVGEDYVAAAHGTKVGNLPKHVRHKS